MALDFRAALAVVELRHLIVHNNGVVSKRFLAATGRTDLKAGDKYNVDARALFNSCEALQRISDEIDTQLLQGVLRRDTS